MRKTLPLPTIKDLAALVRAFRQAMRAAESGDVRPAILLTYRYP